jgi:peptidoglycan/xylan/chitin deacetylase (PgdA/CDA1 family)
LAPVSARAALALGVPRTLPRSGARADPRPGTETAPGGAAALTFDDGPHPEGTPAILEVLASAGVGATFFLIGEQVERRPQLAARILAAGHLVALHGYRHRLQLRLGAAAIRGDLERGAAVVEDAIGQPIRWHRPPYGIYSPSGLDAVHAKGLTPLLWSRWGKDWRRFTTPSRIVARATREVSDGDVILLHDADFYSARGSHRRTAEALPDIIAALKRRGLDTVLPV